MIGALRWIDPPTSAFMLADRIASWRSDGDKRTHAPLQHVWVDLEDVAPAMLRAVVAAEDQKLATHHGFDLASIRDAVSDRARGGRLRGASTITQQVAKNLFLWNGRSWVRKGLEAQATVLIELLWPKRRILEVYVNVAAFGDGVYGVGAASERFFGVPPAELTAAQAALLAAVLPSPTRLRADRPSAYVRERQAWILGQMPRVRLPEGTPGR